MRPLTVRVTCPREPGVTCRMLERTLLAAMDDLRSSSQRADLPEVIDVTDPSPAFLLSDFDLATLQLEVWDDGQGIDAQSAQTVVEFTVHLAETINAVASVAEAGKWLWDNIFARAIRRRHGVAAIGEPKVELTEPAPETIELPDDTNRVDLRDHATQERVDD